MRLQGNKGDHWLEQQYITDLLSQVLYLELWLLIILGKRDNTIQFFYYLDNRFEV